MKEEGKDEVSLDVRQTVVPTSNTEHRGQDRVYNIVGAGGERTEMAAEVR